ncbi:hypothetical protein ACWGR4_30680 [Embleya sp. NPDC055664]
MDEHGPFQREEHRRHFEDVVDEAVRSPGIQARLSQDAGHDTERAWATTEQARTFALDHAADIAEAAWPEYEMLLRAEREAGVTMRELERSGRIALGSALVILAGGAAAIALATVAGVIALAGGSPAPWLLATAACTAVALTAGVGAAAAMVDRAMRNAREDDAIGSALRALDAWHAALLRRGVLPCLESRFDAAEAGRPGDDHTDTTTAAGVVDPIGRLRPMPPPTPGLVGYAVVADGLDRLFRALGPPPHPSRAARPSRVQRPGGSRR